MFRIAARFGSFAGLGVSRGLEREVSRARAAGPAGAPEGELYARTALGWNLLAFSSLSAAAVITSFVVEDPGWIRGLRGFAAAIVTEQAVVYALSYLRAARSLKRYAIVETAGAALHLAFAVALGGLWGLPGAFAGFALACACAVGLAARYVPLRPAVSRERLRRLLITGFPQALTLFLAVALGTADSLAVAAFGGTALLGYYAFAVALSGLVAAVGWVVRTVIFPDLFGSAESAGRGPALAAHLRATVLPFARLYPVLLGALALAIEPAVELLLPRYAAAVPAARIFVFTGAASAVASLAGLGMIAADRQRTLPYFGAFALLVNVSISVLALRSGAGLEAVAAGALLAQALNAGFIVALTARAAGLARPWRAGASALRTLSWCACVVFLVGRLGQHVPWPGTAAAAFTAILYAVALLPWLPALRSTVQALAAEEREAARRRTRSGDPGLVTGAEDQEATG